MPGNCGRETTCACCLHVLYVSLFTAQMFTVITAHLASIQIHVFIGSEDSPMCTILATAGRNTINYKTKQNNTQAYMYSTYSLKIKRS